MYINSGAFQDLEQAFEALQPESDQVWLSLVAADDEHTTPEQLIHFCNKKGIQLIGGVFPGLIVEGQQKKKGALIRQFNCWHRPQLLPRLDQGIETIPFLDIPQPEGDMYTCLTLVDGLTKNISDLLKKLHGHLGNKAKFIGGGCGNAQLQQAPCVFSNDGVFQDAAIFCVLKHRAALSVQHGWQKLNGPLVATRTEGNIIYELNWDNAFKVYQSYIFQDAQLEIAPDNFFSIAKSYPFGIYKENQEDIVRDPISVGPEGELICVGEVPENTVLYLLKGEKANLIKSAEIAAQEIKAVIEERGGKGLQPETLLIDCFSRTLFLENDFQQEISVFNTPAHIECLNNQPFGALTLGEISSLGAGNLEFFNKTLVVGALY